MGLIAEDTGVTSVGGVLSYCAATTLGTIPTSTSTDPTYKELARVVDIGELAQELEQVDVTAIRDSQKRYKAGRADVGGTFDVEVYCTDDTQAQWAEALTAQQTDGVADLCFQIALPDLTQAYFVFGKIPETLPSPNITNADDGVTMTITISVELYYGPSTKLAYVGRDATVDPTEAES